MKLSQRLAQLQKRADQIGKMTLIVNSGDINAPILWGVIGGSRTLRAEAIERWLAAHPHGTVAEHVLGPEKLPARDGRRPAAPVKPSRPRPS